MNKKDLDKFKKILQEQKERLLVLHEKTRKEDLKLSPDDLPDEVDLATSELNQSLVFTLRGRERSLLPKIEKALERIEKGEFGICERCGEEIGLKRLEVRPVATLCINCKEEQEHTEKMYA